MNDLSVRYATLDDWTFIAQMERNRRVTEEVLRAKIDLHDLVIAESDAGYVGYLRLDPLWSCEPFIGLIWVVEAQRRRGVGKALLRFIEDDARDAGWHAVYSSTNADEPPPQAWHRHVGFEECGFIAGHNPGGVGEVFFRKSL